MRDPLVHDLVDDDGTKALLCDLAKHFAGLAAPDAPRAEAEEKDEAAVALGRNPKRPRPSPRDSFAKLVKEREEAARAAQPQAPTAPTVQAQVEAFLALGPEDVDPLQ